MVEQKINPKIKKDYSWIWRIVILVVVILFILGFYLLLGGDSLLDIFKSKGGGDSDNSDGGSWLDSLGDSGGADDVIPAPPALPS